MRPCSSKSSLRRAPAASGERRPLLRRAGSVVPTLVFVLALVVVVLGILFLGLGRFGLLVVALVVGVLALVVRLFLGDRDVILPIGGESEGYRGRGPGGGCSDQLEGGAPENLRAGGKDAPSGLGNPYETACSPWAGRRTEAMLSGAFFCGCGCRARSRIVSMSGFVPPTFVPWRARTVSISMRGRLRRFFFRLAAMAGAAETLGQLVPSAFGI